MNSIVTSTVATTYTNDFAHRAFCKIKKKIKAVLVAGLGGL
jgi:hypothetical protein